MYIYIYIHTHYFSYIIFHHGLSQEIGYTSLGQGQRNLMTIFPKYICKVYEKMPNITNYLGNAKP